ncbi:hypothetical protein ABW21_db0200007 [Orbilia brochopaga]|nr:hypothetical protein ABW21_db0200007 [Drechslerella brochopaga]
MVGFIMTRNLSIRLSGGSGSRFFSSIRGSGDGVIDHRVLREILRPRDSGDGIVLLLDEFIREWPRDSNTFSKLFRLLRRRRCRVYSGLGGCGEFARETIGEMSGDTSGDEKRDGIGDGPAVLGVTARLLRGDGTGLSSSGSSSSAG